VSHQDPLSLSAPGLLCQAGQLAEWFLLMNFVLSHFACGWRSRDNQWMPKESFERETVKIASLRHRQSLVHTRSPCRKLKNKFPTSAQAGMVAHQGLRRWHLT
jgi:hypothetical protein